MTIPIINADTGEYRVGRKTGSPNATSAERNAAIIAAAEYVRGGMAMDEAIAEVHKRFRINHTPEYLSRLVKEALK